MLDGKFRISLNRKYVVGSRVMQITMVHEACHILTHGEAEGHGPQWQACMNDRIEILKNILIDRSEP